MKPGIYVDKIETNNYIFLFYKMDYSLFCCALKRELPKRALTCNSALPIRALPIRAVRLISEYSKPLTRPDWRESKPIITILKLYLIICPPTSELHYIVLNNMKQTEWCEMYYYIKRYGLKKFNEDFYMYD